MREKEAQRLRVCNTGIGGMCCSPVCCASCHHETGVQSGQLWSAMLPMPSLTTSGYSRKQTFARTWLMIVNAGVTGQAAVQSTEFTCHVHCFYTVTVINIHIFNPKIRFKSCMTFYVAGSTSAQDNSCYAGEKKNLESLRLVMLLRGVCEFIITITIAFDPHHVSEICV